jgi:hypothetical protein
VIPWRKYKEQMIKFNVSTEVRILSKKIAESINLPDGLDHDGNDGYMTGKTHTRVKELNEVLANSVAPCSISTLLEMSKPDEWQTTDGQHFTPAFYKEWSKKIVRSHSSLP